MTKKLSSLLAVLGFLVLTASCDRPACKNANSFFDEFSPDAKEYKNELVKQLANVDKSKLSYWMESFTTRSIFAHSPLP
jgi:hypothetical protein